MRYLFTYAPGHPSANAYGYIYTHRLVAENALGHYLPEGAEVHHVDGNCHNNASNNLVICQDSDYHRLLHVRQRAFRACGHADWRICKFCSQYSPTTELVKNWSSFYHQICNTRYRAALRQKHQLVTVKSLTEDTHAR